MHRAIGYIRVSTESQGENGIGLTVQKAMIEEFAQSRGYRLLRIYQDVHTGRGENSVKDRGGLSEALEASRKKKVPIIVSDVDRLGRHEADVKELIDSGRIISAADGEGADRAVLRARARKAEVEGDLIAKRTRSRLGQLKAEGKKLGNRKNLEEAALKGGAANKDRHNKQVLALGPVIDDIRAAGARKASDIAAALNERGSRSPRGILWSADNVRRLLRSVDKHNFELEQQKIRDQKAAHSNPLWGTW